MKKDLISIKDLNEKDIADIFSLTKKLKKYRAGFNKSLSGKTLALIFQKPSNRTRVSFEVGMFQLGGYSIYLGPDEINLGIRESIKDVAKTLSRYIDGIVLRTFAHSNVLEMAAHATAPVINGLSDFSHPCQALADVFTVKEKTGEKNKIVLAYVGDGNNVCHSLLYACVKTGISIHVCTPKGYEPDTEVFKGAEKEAGPKGISVKLFSDPRGAVKNVDVIYTDVWASMGQESESEKRKDVFKDFQINANLVKASGKRPYIMHCLPAHRGEEITDEAIDSAESIVFDQAENRMHVQKAILIKLLKGGRS